MFKDYDKYLTTSLKVYLFVLVIIFIMKMVGLDYFGLELDNSVILKINDLYIKYHLDIIWTFISIYLQLYLYVGIVCKKRNLYKYSFIGTIVTIIVQIILMKTNKMEDLYFIYSTLLLLIMPMIINKKIQFKRQLFYIILLTIYQCISLFIKNINFNYDYGNLLIDSILNIDQLLLLAITYNVVLMKGENKIWVQVASLSSLKKVNLKKLLKKLQKNLHNFNEKEKVEKITIIIYSILSLIWNTLSVVIILIVAKLNDTFIECIFILTSFWLSKGKFGKPFHLKSMTHCFIVSNLTYYVLNRVTTPLGISIIIPIMLGVGLSYVTSKLVKKSYKPLYRGMPEDLFEETILKVTDKDSDKYAICYDFYINKKSTVALSIKYNYSEAGIRKIKDRINNKIKEL